MTQLRDKDIAVLQAIEDGASTTSEIKEATTLTLREINYSLTEFSLEELGLVDIERPQGREWRVVDGHKKNIWKPKQVSMTDLGIQRLAQFPNEKAGKFEDISHRELIQEVQELQERLDRLEKVFKDFRQKVMEEI